MDRMKTHGAISWNELITTDREGAKKFYGEMFGWDFTDHEMGPVTYHEAKVEGEAMAGIMDIPPNLEDAKPSWGMYITVNDADASAKQCVELGGQIFFPPEDIPGVGRFAVLQDPQGAIFLIMSYTM